ncbi:MAG TPA: NHL repeat-containing protein [Bryobacteraceae bacterium]|nr:NHL repeat-containing protein [Bryobacteraceae bacterium]
MRPLSSALLVLIASCCVNAQTGSTISTFAGTGSPGTTGDGAQAAAALLNGPNGVAVDSVGNVYIADTSNHRVRIVNVNGVISNFAGNGFASYSGDGFLATAAGLQAPTGVAVDSSGNVYIADAVANVVREVSGGVITTLAGNGTAGFGGDAGLANAANLNYPYAVAVDGSGNVYIADTLNHRIRKVSGGNINTIAGTAVLGFSGDGGPATAATLFAPMGVAVDSLGNVYISDTQNNRIRRITSGTITTVAGNGIGGYGGDGGAATSGQMYLPRGIAVDATGSIYIAEYANDIIRKIANGKIITVAGHVADGYTGDGGLATSATMSGPTSVALDPTGGYTYIADSRNNAIRLITNTTTSGVIPQFAAGGSYVTDFYVINKSTQPTSLSISFFNDQGASAVVPLTGGTSSATFQGFALTDTIPALGTTFYEAGSLGPGTSLSGSAVIQSNPSIVVQALFRHQGTSGTPYEATISETLGSFEAEFPFDGTTYGPTGAQITTGIAIVNIDGANPATVTCVARDNAGTVIPGAITVPALNPQGHWAAYQFPALVGKRGTLDCTSTTKIGVTALRFLGTDAVSTLPVILK